MDVVEKSMGEVDVSTPSAESEVKVENDKKVLFKKPQIGLVIGPRRGKIIGKCRTLESKTNVNRPTLGLGLDTVGDTALGLGLIPEVAAGESNNSVGSEDKDSAKDGVEKLPAKTTSDSKSFKSKPVPGLSPAQELALNTPIPYKEPKWGGCPKTNYNFEVLKSGKILEHIDLSNKSFFVFGRLANADVMMAHPTISRHHAVVQYRTEGSYENSPGFYLYDLDSTHGTFLNKNRIKPNMYVRLHVGHVLKFGCSSRLFVLRGPEEDEEEESELTATQIRDKRKVEILRRIQQGETVTREESQGIDWGMGEDADEETDLSVNPFAMTHNEELYLDDPKKTLRGWFEREGIELEYDLQERGVAQFLCRVQLPVESARNGVVMAEAVVQGKKKEAVVQCALEACRILDRYGLLRQATHESKKRKARDWAADDFYDSDEDSFLDRTGSVEQKRLARMRAAGRREVLTYQDLVERHAAATSALGDAERQWLRATESDGRANKSQCGDDEDELDAFMKNLSYRHRDKLLISKLKSSLAGLKSEEARLRKLVNVARPANLPELKPPRPTAETTASKMTAILGEARRRVKRRQGAAGPQRAGVGPQRDDGPEEEEEDEEEEEAEESASVSQLVGQMARDDGPEEEEEEEEESATVSQSVSQPISRPVVSQGDEEEPTTKGPTEKEVERRKKRNRMRMLQRNAKMRKESNAEWSEVAAADPSLYSTWTPPPEQSGDGRTSLNERLGY